MIFFLEIDGKKNHNELIVKFRALLNAHIGSGGRLGGQWDLQIHFLAVSLEVN